MSGNAIASPHFESARAGKSILETGGNAVDAAVAIIAAQGVVAPETCGLGGDLFALVHRPGWRAPRTLNSSGRAGSRLDPSQIRTEHGQTIPTEHPAVVTIPGCVDGLTTLAETYGSLTLSRVLEPGINLAAEGFEVSTEQAAALQAKAGTYSTNPAVSDFYPDGRPRSPGERVTRAALAGTLGAVAQGGRTAFYEGAPGEDIMAASGLITPDDLRQSCAEWVEPISADVAGLTCWTTPPNTQGYLTPGSLALFESLDPPDDPNHPQWWHLLIESYRCLAWELKDLAADPRFFPLPGQLILDADRLQRAADSVSPDSTGVWPKMGIRTDTAFACVADKSGMAVSIIQSNYRGLGSRYGAARSGFLLQDRGLGFNLTPGHPNEALPGKRPFHTLAPTLWTSGDQPAMTLGTRGGHIQPQMLIQVAARAILTDSDLIAAQNAPRWSIDGYGPNTPGALQLEPGSPTDVVHRLSALGHPVTVNPARLSGWGPVSAIRLAGDSRETAADPRSGTATALTF